MGKEKKYIEQKPKDDEEVLFACFGEAKKKNEKSFVLEEGKPYDMRVLDIKETDKGYRYVYKVMIDKVKLPVVLLGNASLNNGFGRGAWDVATVEEGDDVRLTYLGMYKSKKTGRSGYKIKIEVAE